IGKASRIAYFRSCARPPGTGPLTQQMSHPYAPIGEESVFGQDRQLGLEHVSDTEPTRGQEAYGPSRVGGGNCGQRTYDIGMICGHGPCDQAADSMTDHDSVASTQGANQT